MKLLLSPHADDETLFACYTLLRERPHVALCLPGAPRHGAPDVRVSEFAAAMAVVGCPWLSLVDSPLETTLAKIAPDIKHAWAPLSETGGNDDHNFIGDLAARLWPGKVTFYTTYTPGGRTTIGDSVAADSSWPAIKRAALACYKSQQSILGMREHFERPLDEYEVSWEDAMVAV